MDEYISREAVFQVVHGIARGITDRDTEAFKAKDMKAFYMAKGAKEILNSVDTDLCYIPTANVRFIKHGKWLKRMSTSDSLKCSVCGNNHEYSTTYCPNCGAKMDIIYEDDKVRAIKVTGWDDDTRNLK